MNTYMVRQPIMNSEQKVEAYEVVYQQDSTSLYNRRDSRVADAVVMFLSNLESTNFLNGKDAFLTFSPNLIMQKVPNLFSESKLVIQIEDNVLIHPETIGVIREYKEKGFRIALADFEFAKRYMDVLPLADYMKVDFEGTGSPTVETRLAIAREYGMKAIACNVNTAAAKEQALSLEFDFFQGKSIAEMVRSKTPKVEHLKSNFFRLVSEISKQVPDFDEITKIVSLDVTLTFSLLRIVNSAYFALPNRVKDIKQALTILGLTQLKHWVYLLSFASDGGISDELIKTSFLRATFCQELSQFAKNFPVNRNDCYLLGMFSVLDVLLQVNIEDAVKELPIVQEVKDGLTGVEGQSFDLLTLCIEYEKGNWAEMGKRAKSLEIPESVIGQKYMEAAEYVNEIWGELSRAVNK